MMGSVLAQVLMRVGVGLGGRVEMGVEAGVGLGWVVVVVVVGEVGGVAQRRVAGVVGRVGMVVLMQVGMGEAVGAGKL
jgi:hypothetical protein